MVQNPEVSWTHKNGWRSCSDSTVPWQLANFPEFSGQLHISKRSVCHSGNGLKIVEVKNYHPQLSMKIKIPKKTTIQNTLSFRCNRITYNLCLWVSPYLTLQNITHKTFQHPKHPVIAPPRFVSLSYLTLEDNNEITAKAPQIALPFQIQIKAQNLLRALLGWWRHQKTQNNAHMKCHNRFSGYFKLNLNFQTSNYESWGWANILCCLCHWLEWLWIAGQDLVMSPK